MTQTVEIGSPNANGCQNMDMFNGNCLCLKAKEDGLNIITDEDNGFVQFSLIQPELRKIFDNNNLLLEAYRSY